MMAFMFMILLGYLLFRLSAYVGTPYENRLNKVVLGGITMYVFQRMHKKHKFYL